MTAEEIEEILESTVFLKPYLSVAIAQVATPDGPSTEILLVHADEAAATANAELTPSCSPPTSI